MLGGLRPAGEFEGGDQDGCLGSPEPRHRGELGRVRLRQPGQRAEPRQQALGERLRADSRTPAGADEHGEELSVGQRARPVCGQALARALGGGKVSDTHELTLAGRYDRAT